jgi:inositol transporter-like SP family MFS transporter
MRFSDRNYRTRKWLWGIGSIMGIASWAMFIVIPPTTIAPIIINIVVFAAAAALAGEAFYKVFSQELFPTMLRGTAQGFSFGIARLLLGFWSFFVPTIAKFSFPLLAALLTLSLVICGVVGFFGMPDTSGKSLEQIQSERAAT